MNGLNKNDIITALATPFGKSAVAIIRVSGSGCTRLLSEFLEKPLKVGQLCVNTFKSGSFTENLMAVAYKAPKSYTGEDLVELFPHGNPLICDIIIKTLLKNGVRLAERGEFTKRAFLNGKLDLMQCEALADIIDAQTAEQLDYGNKRYLGEFKALAKVQQLLKDSLSSIEAVLHYSDEMEQNEIDGAEMNAIGAAVDSAAKLLEKEIAGFAGGKIINDGFKVALIGAPNVGKSTLLNALTDSDRAIVTPIAGTTRDTIDGNYVYCGRKFTVTDTAGLNTDTADYVEKIGIDRAYKAAKDADAVVFVTDGSEINIDKTEFERFITVKNKCDDQNDVGTEYGKAGKEYLRISAKNKINITALKQMLFDMCPKDFGSLCNHRQYECVTRCLDSLNAAKREASKAEGLEIVAALLYEAYSAISELYGESADESIISAVFERFCVGK
ncbi:MAG: tRNA uridine-5-carboxymethylaminomethyl(34) synthesis GTPase MnmE [Clostridiales bacterium]|nr:tRNA uridine-5-carboxymethylaminomethyl(34) synthesis GTPase MnmE [Clostridiales bacterium]